MTDSRRDAHARPHIDVASLRVEPDVIESMADHFCPLCRCTKSGWATDPNVAADWCEDGACPCHDEELRS